MSSRWGPVGFVICALPPLTQGAQGWVGGVGGPGWVSCHLRRWVNLGLPKDLEPPQARVADTLTPGPAALGLRPSCSHYCGS